MAEGWVHHRRLQDPGMRAAGLQLPARPLSLDEEREVAWCRAAEPGVATAPGSTCWRAMAPAPEPV